MSDAILQLLLILAFLAIGLLSVTFPIYAICVTYLRQEKWESEKERRKRIQELKEHISGLTKKLSGEPRDSKPFEEIKNRIEKHETELKNLELKVNYLTVRGAVGRPVINLSLALLTAGVGIYFFNYDILDGVIVFGLFSSLLNVLAVYSLYKTLMAVEHAALRPARTIGFDVRYESTFTQEEKALIGKKFDFVIGIDPEESIEDVSINVLISPELEAKSFPKDSELTKQPKQSVFANYSGFTLERDFMPRGKFYGLPFSVIPHKVGKYQVVLRIDAKNVCRYETSLILDVVGE